VGISYGGGPIEGVHFQRVIQPGSRLFVNGLFDSLYLYPSDLTDGLIDARGATSTLAEGQETTRDETTEKGQEEKGSRRGRRSAWCDGWRAGFSDSDRHWHRRGGWDCSLVAAARR
jgi:hypothetical protein